MENISTSDSQLKFVMKKRNPKIWWSRLTAQPQKQNWIHVSSKECKIQYFFSFLIFNKQIDEKTWISRESNDASDDENNEYRDIRTDYPGVDDFVHEQELGYRKGSNFFFNFK